MERLTLYKELLETLQQYFPPGIPRYLLNFYASKGVDAFANGDFFAAGQEIHNPFLNWSCAVHYSICSGYFHFLELIESKTNIDKESALDTACLYGHMPMVRYFLEKGATNYERGYQAACMYAEMEAITLMRKLGAKDHNMAMKSACAGGQYALVKELVRQGANNYQEALACMKNHVFDDKKKIKIEQYLKRKVKRKNRNLPRRSKRKKKERRLFEQDFSF